MSSQSQMNLKTLRDLPAVLGRTAEGRDMLELAERLGLWSTDLHKTRERPVFPSEFPETPKELSDLWAQWTQEANRITQLVGLLHGQEKYMTLKAKASRASARSRIRAEVVKAAEKITREVDGTQGMSATARKTAIDRVKKTATQINDEAEEATEVREADEGLLFVQMLIASANAAKEVVLMNINSISREISYRGDQMRARIM